MTMQISAYGLDQIRKHEGLRLVAYQDVAGVWTIGYGHTTDVHSGQTIDRQTAEAMLALDVGTAADAVRRNVRVPLTQGQFDALVSWVFNLGEGKLATSTLLKRLNDGDYAGAAAEFSRWVMAGGFKQPGLVARRQVERTMFESGIDSRPNDAFAGMDIPANPPVTAPRSTPVSPALVPALLNILATFAPQLVKIFSDKDKSVPERNVEAGMKVLEIAKEVAGLPSPAAAVERIESMPELQTAFKQAVESRWYELTEAAGGGIEGARAFAVRQSEGNDWRSVGYTLIIAVLSLMIVGGGGALIWVLLTDPNTNAEQRGMLIGAVVALISAVVSFFFGSSVSSRAKDTALVRELGNR
jgi:lysozyme